MTILLHEWIINRLGHDALDTGLRTRVDKADVTEELRIIERRQNRRRDHHGKITFAAPVIEGGSLNGERSVRPRAALLCRAWFPQRDVEEIAADSALRTLNPIAGPRQITSRYAAPLTHDASDH